MAVFAQARNSRKYVFFLPSLHSGESSRLVRSIFSILNITPLGLLGALTEHYILALRTNDTRVTKLQCWWKNRYQSSEQLVE